MPLFQITNILSCLSMNLLPNEHDVTAVLLYLGHTYPTPMNPIELSITINLLLAKRLMERGLI